MKTFHERFHEDFRTTHKTFRRDVPWRRFGHSTLVLVTLPLIFSYQYSPSAPIYQHRPDRCKPSDAFRPHSRRHSGHGQTPGRAPDAFRTHRRRRAAQSVRKSRHSIRRHKRIPPPRRGSEITNPSAGTSSTRYRLSSQVVPSLPSFSTTPISVSVARIRSAAA